MEQPKDLDFSELVTIDDICAAGKVSRWTVRRAYRVHMTLKPPVAKVSTQIFFRVADARAWINQREIDKTIGEAARKMKRRQAERIDPFEALARLKKNEKHIEARA